MSNMKKEIEKKSKETVNPVEKIEEKEDLSESESKEKFDATQYEKDPGER